MEIIKKKNSRLRKEIQLYIDKWVFTKYLVVTAHTVSCNEYL